MAGVLRVIDDVKIEPAASEQPVTLIIRKEIENRLGGHFDDSTAYCDQPIIPFRTRQDWKSRNLAASSRPKLMAAA